MDKTRFTFVYIFLAMMGVLLLQDVIVRFNDVAPLPYSEFQKLLKEGKIKEVVVGPNQIRGELREPLQGKTRFTTNRVEPGLVTELSKYDVKYAGYVESTWLPLLLSWVVPIVLFAGVWVYLTRKMSGRIGSDGLMSIGKSKAKIFVETDTKVTFADVAGVDEAKAELQETVNFLKDPKQYGRLGARMPKGVLLVGPPGTGKTLLSRAVAGEAGVPFFSISGSEFVEMFVGVGAARVRDLFEQARKKAPCIIFIDELDALGRARGAGPMQGGHDEKEQTLNQLLVELDGFDPMSGIVLLAATNRPEILDPALLRAGRFDRQVLLDRPDRIGRRDILAVHLKKAITDDTVDMEAIAGMTPGFTGADLANMVNEAALSATRRGAEKVGMVDFTAALERIVAGLERRNRLLNPREREIVAYHEMGHALASAAIPGSDKVHKVSIIPRGIGALGYTIQRPTEDRYLMTKEELENKMSVLLGGRAAEHLVFGHLSTGAVDDLARTTDTARHMVTRYAMVPKLGNVAYETERTGFLGGNPGGILERTYSEETAREIDCAVREIVDGAFAKARGILERNRDVLETGARELLEKETLDEAAIERLFGEVIKV